MSLLERRQTDSMMEEVNVLITNYTEKELQEAVLEKDNSGWLPIHWVCFYEAPLEVIQMLLDSDTDKKSIFEKDRFGRLPIHLACESNAPVEVIQLLLESDVGKKSIFEKDEDGQLPINNACVFDGNVEVVKLLLKARIGDRIDQLGLAQWRIGVEELINAMTEEDSKAKKVLQICARLSKYEKMEGNISLLALAIWRTSCLKWGAITFQSMQEMEDLLATDEAFDPVEYKRERRIKSGADIINRGVLPFLPVDDEESSSSDDYFDGYFTNYGHNYGDY
jgi:ankyrin repeat protein